MAKTDTKSQPDVVVLQRAIRRKNKKIKRLYIGIALLVVLMISGAIFGALQYKSLKDENALLSNPQESARVEKEKLKKNVAALIDVPQDEEPQFLSVTDATQLKQKGEAFFAKAENGDQVLLYQNAKKVVLYRPSTNKVIEVAPITVNNDPKSTNTTNSKTQKPSTQQPGVETTP